MRAVVSTAKLVAAGVLAGLLAGCPASQGRDGDDDVPGDAGVDAPPDGPLACENPQPTCTLTITYQGPGNSVSLRGDFAPDGWTVGVPMMREAGAWTATIPVADEQVVLYKFVVDGTWLADPANARTSPDGYGGRNSVVRVDCDGCPKPAPIDWRDAILYFVMIDRFHNGDPSNDGALGGIEWMADFQGGDLAGVIQKIEEGYFAELGVNALWLTSPLDNADHAGIGTDGYYYSGYHGYWPKDLDAVERRIGTEAELERLVEVAHAHGIKVVLDYVMNHVHAESPVYQQNPSWFWPNSNGWGGNCVCGDGCSWDDDYQRKRCWFTDYLPDFDFNNDDARRYSVQNAIAWAKKLGIDGYRLDAVKHLEDSWLLDLRARLSGEVEEDQVFYLVGETYTGDRDLIRYYVRPDTMLDGQFDFPLRARILEHVLRRSGSMGDLVGFLDDNQSFYGPGAVMSTFIGNHDVPRVIHIAEDVPLFGDWDGGRHRAWQNRPELPSSPNPFERIAVAYTLLMTTPGVPLIYYGDEIGLPGAGDPDNRRFMQWSNYTSNQVWLRERLAALGRIRREQPALRRGQRTTLGTTGDVYTYRMSDGGSSVYVSLNRGDDAEPAVGLPAGTYRDLITGGTVTAPLQVPPRTGLVLQPM